MKGLFTFAALVGCLWAASPVAWGQEGATQLTAKDVGVTPGVPLPSGLGYFANPDNYHNLTLGVQAGLGVSDKSPTFGYDNLSVSTRFKLGNNRVGKHLSLLAGFSDWRVPAYRKVFADSVIDRLPNQGRFAAQSANSATIGLSFSYGRDTVVQPFSPAIRARIREIDEFLDSDVLPGATLTSKQRNELMSHPAGGLTVVEINRFQTEGATAPQRTLLRGKFRTSLVDSLLANPISGLQKAERRKERQQLVLQAFREAQRDLQKNWSFSTGFLGRVTSFAEETDVQAYDLFMLVAKGVKGVDAVAVGHYLHYLDNSLPKWALTGSAGAFVNLSNNGPTPVLGLTAGYGRYAFRELHDVVPEARRLSRNPTTNRLDVVLSYSGAPDNVGQSSAGIGFRYSRVSPSLLPAYNVFAIVLSTNFALIK